MRRRRTSHRRPLLPVGGPLQQPVWRSRHLPPTLGRTSSPPRRRASSTNSATSGSGSRLRSSARSDEIRHACGDARDAVRPLVIPDDESRYFGVGGGFVVQLAENDFVGSHRRKGDRQNLARNLGRTREPLIRLERRSGGLGPKLDFSNLGGAYPRVNDETIAFEHG